MANKTKPQVRSSNAADIGIGRRLRLTHLAFSQALRDELKKDGFSFGQFVHLERLWEEDGLTQVELSKRVGVQMASSTAVIAQLDELKLITRVRDAVDKRKIIVNLTAKGAALREPLLARVRATNVVARVGLSAAELTQLFSLLERILDNLHDAHS